jgi:hypothetical protein
VRSPATEASMGSGKEMQPGGGGATPVASDERGRWVAEEEGGATLRRWKEQPCIVRRKVTGRSRVSANARRVTC